MEGNLNFFERCSAFLKGIFTGRREAAAAREAELSRAIDIARKYGLQEVIERAVREEHLSPREALEDYDLIAPGEDF